MFVTLGLVLQLLMATEGVAPWGAIVASGVLWAAILMPAGFFLSVIGRDPAKPNALRWLIPLGALSLVVGVVGAGLALIIGA